MQRPFVTSASYRAAVDLLADVRRETGLSQAQLALKLGKSRSFVSKVEHVERRLDFVEFIALARALEVTPEDLIKRVSDQIGEDLDF